MSNKLNIFLSALVALTFVGVGTNYVLQQDSGKGLNSIDINKLFSEPSELELKYDALNIKLDEANKESNVDKKKIDDLLQEKKRLEAELQAKAEAKSKIAKASEEVVNRVTNTSTASASSGSKESLMSAAGIPQADWYFVDCVIAGCDGVSAEGGWGGTQRWNTAGSGAYGLCQALPGSKMASAGADWETNPITQLKWCNSYAQEYGGWAAAWKFRQCVGQCFSTKPGVGWIKKDHTWW